MKRKLNILLCIMAITAMLICGCGGATTSTTGSEAGKTATSAESTAKTETSVSTETH